MNLAPILILSALPFVGVGVLFWMGQRNSFSARYRKARESRAAKADEVERLGERLAADDDRLREAQRRLER